MTIEILNESGHELDVKGLATLSRFVMDEMRVHPLAELCIKAVDEDTMAKLNEQWMEKDGPTDSRWRPMELSRTPRLSSPKSRKRVYSVTSCSARPSPSARARPPATAPPPRSSC